MSVPWCCDEDVAKVPEERPSESRLPGVREIRGFVSFEFDLPGALLEQLVMVLDQMADEVVSADHVALIPDAQGVYQLFLDGTLVYIGKTDAEAGLRKRLLRHLKRISDRPRLQQSRVSFKAVQVLVFTAMDLETALIKHYKKAGKTPAWNGSGFGSNDPGRNREKTNVKPEGFDASFPISIDFETGVLPAGTYSAAEALAKVKDSLAYTFRYERPHPDLDSTTVAVTRTPLTVREIVRLALDALPAGWQATLFPSHVILYKESQAYEYGERI
jgi:hypothetical protein